MIVDLNRKESTAKDRTSYVRKFLLAVNKPIEEITASDIRNFLVNVENGKELWVKSLRLFFGQFLNKPEVIRTFKVPRKPFKPKTIPSKEELQETFNKLKTTKQKAMFLLLATSGLRSHELLSLEVEDIDLEKRMILPKQDNSETKRCWVTFFNEEAKYWLKRYLKEANIKTGRIFSKARNIRSMRIKRFNGKIIPQVLREWFCCEMGRLGVPDRYVDAFCGRVPRSVLARHYTDFSPERLKEIYDKANLKVLE